MKRIKKFGVLQTAKVAALLYTIVSAIFIIPFGFIAVIFSSVDYPFSALGGGGILIFFLPLLYGFIGFITVAIGCSIYNLISDKIGGIEVEVEDGPSPFAGPQNYQQG